MESLHAYGEIVQKQYQTILATYSEIKDSPLFAAPLSRESSSQLETTVDKIDATYKLLMTVVEALKQDDITSSNDLLAIQMMANLFSREVEIFISIVDTTFQNKSTTVQQ